jgi:hypothetical protein
LSSFKNNQENDRTAAKYKLFSNRVLGCSWKAVAPYLPSHPAQLTAIFQGHEEF